MPLPRTVWPLLVALLLLPGCRDSGAPPGKPGAAASAAPVVAPALTLTEIVVARPAETWRRSRALLGSAAVLLPVTWPVLLTSLLELPATAAGLFDDQVPLGGLLLEGRAGPELVLALHVRSGAELVALLTTGQQATHSVESLAADRLLVPKQAPSAPRVLVVRHNFLLVGQSREAVALAGPYLTRGAAPSRPEAADVELSSDGRALAGPISAWLSRSWLAARRELEAKAVEAGGRAGRAADFADPRAVLAVADRWVAALTSLLGSATGLRIGIQLLPDRIAASGELTTSAASPLGAWLGALPPGALAGLSRLPADVGLGLSIASTASLRSETAARIAGGAREILGSRLSDADAAELAQALAALAASSGDELGFGVVLDPVPCVVLVVATADAEGFSRALRRTLALPARPAFARPLAHWLGTPRTSFAPLPGFDGDHARVGFTGPGGRSTALHLSWQAGDGRVALALGAEPKATTAQVRRLLDAGARLGGGASGEVLRRAGGDAGVLGLLVPSRYHAAVPPGAAVLGLGGAVRAGAPTAWLKLELPSELVSGVVRALGAP